MSARTDVITSTEKMEKSAMSQMAPRHRFPLVIAGITLALIVESRTAAAETLAAWVQLVGPGRDAIIRVITDEARCPTLKADGVEVPMQVRAAPGPYFKSGADAPPA